MLEKLKQKYSDTGHERLGFILSEGEVVELDNAHDVPQHGAKYSSSDLFRYMFSGDFTVKATWHTHPSETKNLSGDDYVAFKNYPDIDHYVIGNDGVRRYYVEEGVLKHE